MIKDKLLELFNSVSIDELQTSKILGGATDTKSEISCTDAGDPGDKVDTVHHVSYDEGSVEMCTEEWTTEDTIPYRI